MESVKMVIQFWSDYSCPFCYIGETRLFKSISRLGIEDKVTLTKLAYELHPGITVTEKEDVLSLFSGKYNMDKQAAERQIELIAQEGKKDGLSIRLQDAQYGPTRDAHRLYKLAYSQGGAVLARRTSDLLFSTFFTLYKDLSKQEILLHVAQEAGIDARKAEDMLYGTEFTDDVLHDEQLAAHLGIDGVPFFLIDEQYYIPGAVPESAFMHTLENILRKTT